MLFTRPFCSLRRWNPDGQIERVTPPSADELPQWPRRLFCAQVDYSNDGGNPIDDSASLRFSATPHGRRELSLSSTIRALCKDDVITTQLDGGDLFLVIREVRKAEILKEISSPQLVRLWLDLVRLMIYAYPDPGLDFELRAGQCDAPVQFAIAFELMGRKRFAEAYVLWHSIVKELDGEHRHHANEWIPAIIELIKCCNFLSKEPEGEAIALKVLDNYVNTGEQICDLQIVHVDSLIGQKKYERAEEALLMAMQNEHISAYTQNVANLRMNKIKRRSGSLTTLESFVDLREIDKNLHDPSKAAVLKDEYLDELSATLGCISSSQTLGATSEMSIRAIQDLLLDPKARKDNLVLTQIAQHAKVIEWNSSVRGVGQVAKQVTQPFSTATTSISSNELQPMIQQLSETESENFGVPSSEKPQQRSHIDLQPLPQSMQPESGNTTVDSTSIPKPSSMLGKGSIAGYQANRSQRGNEAFRRQLLDLPNADNRTPRLPETRDFPSSLQFQIIPKRASGPIKYVVVLLHQFGESESSLRKFALILHDQQLELCLVLLRGLEPVKSSNSGHHWGDPTGDLNGPFLNIERVLTEIIKTSLIAQCGFSPRDIVLIGHGQGGMAVLATAVSWQETELGGVVSFGGPLPGETGAKPTLLDMIRMPALIIGAALGDRTTFARNRIESRYDYFNTYISTEGYDIAPATEVSMRLLLGFLARHLQGEEWMKQAVISFDGGGVRSYGSLLILRELMNKIGEEEERRDALEGAVPTVSSFAPWPYKPTFSRAFSKSSSTSDVSSTRMPVASSTERLPNSSLYLPCHYFDYAVGTSNSSLISIMLSRLRMTVDDCIAEYTSFNQKIFDTMRLLTFGATTRHKFDYRVLEAVIQNITARHSDESEEDVLDFPLDEDLCRTLVMAYTMRQKSELPYLFRTYYQPSPNTMLRKGTQIECHGLPSKLRLWQIIRATLAAPRYYPPIRLKQSTGDGTDGLTFKSGGFTSDNPSKEAYYDVVQKHGASFGAVGVFISIGAGLDPFDLFQEDPWRTDVAHDDMTNLSHIDGKDIFDYYRFDGGKRLSEVQLDEWESRRFRRLTGKSSEPGSKTLEKIYVATAAYLDDSDVQKDLNECAKLLVKRRRLRTRDASAWDRYASASFYECSYQGCKKFRVNTAQLFKDHLKREHYPALADIPLELAMRQNRRCWIYRNAPLRDQQVTKSTDGEIG
ncbi:MAG: hypothetical protein LQ338_001161 [Usnochroma carphineum]|nr:MAG: hypothetical protein LQ338_001161 [Usnochroma carphineum]